MTSSGPPVDPELTRLLLEEFVRHEPALAPDRAEDEQRRAIHALKGSAGIAGERGLSEALARLERRVHTGDPPLLAWERYPASFRNSPGMKRLLEKMGVPAYWRAHRFPPQCRAGAGKDFSCD